jgi:ligand-binding sensor domain-containing protein/signal transduction histidine kinase
MAGAVRYELRVRYLAICLFAIAFPTIWLPVIRARVTHPSSKKVPRSAQSAVTPRHPTDYIRSDFTVENGLPDNVVDAIVETENGLLWVGTQSGLASFDGREFTAVNLQTAGSPAQGSVHSMVESSAGDLWVGTDAGVVRIPKAALDQFSPQPLTFYHLGSGPSDQVQTLLQTRDGKLWAGTNRGLYREESGKFVELIPDIAVNRIVETLDGRLLVLGNAKIFEWDGHKAVPRPDLSASAGVPEDHIFDIFQDQDGTTWYSTHEGLVRRGSQALPQLRPVSVATTPTFRRPYRDLDGNLWVLNLTGVYRIDGDVMEDSPVVNLEPRCLEIDREGGYWVGTNGSGLIHFKPRTVHMFTTADGLSSNIPMALLASHDGRLWIGGNCGLSVYDGKRFASYKESDGLGNTCVWTLAEDRNRDMWIGTYGGGLFRFRDGRFVHYGTEQGLVNGIVLQVVVADDNSLWIGTPYGISHMQNGHFRNYSTAEGLSSDQILNIHQDHSRTIWVATQGGIDRLVGDRFVPFSPVQPQDRPLSMRFAEDSLGNLYTADSPKGVSLIRNNQLIAVNEELRVLDMVESPQHDLWFSGTNGIVRIRLNDLKSAWSDQEAPLNYEIIDRSDGLNSVQCSGGYPNMTITPDNRLWVGTVKGLAMLDLAHLAGASRRPKVFIGDIIVGTTKLFAGSGAILPAGTHRVELHLAAVDLASPEKVRLQYRLDEVDAGWLDASASRTAVYTNIPVGSHNFHVRASRSDGVWDREGIVYTITQRPYFYQTMWFRAGCVAAIVLLLWGFYQLRLWQLESQYSVRLEERVRERTRIARELHDTLLQSLHGLLFQFQAARNMLPRSPENAMKGLDEAILGTEQAIAESRDAIHDLRSQLVAQGDLAQLLTEVGEELAGVQGENQESPSFDVVVEGEPETLSPMIQREVYNIARELIRNGFHHANAHRIEVEIRYGKNQLRMRVRDDGKGIDSKILEGSRRPGHWGLPGVRERARRIGSQLDFWSQPGAGTEVELTVPTAIAYETAIDGSKPLRKAGSREESS